MTFTENISLQNYVDSAGQKFAESENRLSQIEGSFQTRMNGKTTGGIIGAILGTVCWFVAFCGCFWYFRGYIDSRLSLACLGIGVALIISLLIDEIVGFSYYGKISSYKDNITQLKNRVSIGRSSIQSNQDAFMMSRDSGWNYPLSVGPSIPEEAASIESTMNGMESLKGGFINGLKNILFFAFAIAITGVGSWALIGTAGTIVSGITSVMGGAPLDIGSDTWMTLCLIGMVVAGFVEVLLAKLMWSHTDCSITNITLWIVPLGPVLFLALAAGVTLIVMLVMWAISIAIAIGALVLAGACLFGSISGG